MRVCYMSDDYESGPLGAGTPRLAIDHRSPRGDRSRNGRWISSRSAGRIKWFDVAKGFGFIVPDNGMPDVLLHVTCLRRDGYQAAHEGARIVVEAAQRPRGLQAFRIVSLDEFERASTPPSCRCRAPMSRSCRRAGSSRRSSNGSTACAASASSPAARARRTSSSTWRRCAATASPSSSRASSVLVRFGDGGKGLMAAEVRLADGTLPASH